MHEFIQLTVDGLINGSAYALLGVGFALILGVTGRFHFAYAFTYTLSAYITAVGASSWHIPVIPAVVLGLVVGMVAGVLIESYIYRPLAAGAGANALLVIFVGSLGVSIAGEAAITLLWGMNTVTRDFQAFTVSNLNIQGISFTSLDVVSVGVVWVCILIWGIFLRRSGIGRQVRAVRVNPEMAQAVGIDSRAIYRLVFAIGSLFAGIAALLYTLKFAATPDMGDRTILYALVVAFLGGTSRAPWAVGLTGLGLGLVESWSGHWVSSQWSSMVVFAVLLLYLTQRSAGSLSAFRLDRLRARLMTRPEH